MDKTTITQHFEVHFQSAPDLVVRAPGRVNLIGEHTDYNDGFVFPMAIDRNVWIALRARSDHNVVAYSLDFEDPVSFNVADVTPQSGQWGEYVKGVAWVLAREGLGLRGFDAVIGSDIPVGAGLSSSAAMELATARAFVAVAGGTWDATAMARVGQRAENEWVRVNCGIMDQMASAQGQAGHALLLDCRSLEVELVPLPEGTSVLVLDTSTRRRLAESRYNERREECEKAAEQLGVKALRDIELDTFEHQCGKLSAKPRKRARHVISENARTVAAAKAMRHNDPRLLGRLMNESHVSLRDDFEVSTPALDTMVDAAAREDACYGARMTGAGFGGCAVALVVSSEATRLARRIAATYTEATGIAPRVYVCQASQGADIA